MSTIGSEDCLQVQKHPQKCPSASEAALEDRKKKGVVYEVPCQDCECVYIGETSRGLEKRLNEHKNVVKKHDSYNGIAAHTWTNQYQVDWKAAKTREMEENYWKRRKSGSPAH